MGFFDPIKKKFGDIKEDMRRSEQEQDEFRRQRHLARMKNAPKRAEALENASLQHELKEARSGKRKEGGLKEALGNFSEGMLHGGGGMNFDSGFMLGGSPTPRHTKSKTKTTKKRR